MTAPDERAGLARRFLDEARQRSVEQLPPSVLMRESAELRRLLGQVLGMLAEAQAKSRSLTHQLSAARAAGAAAAHDEVRQLAEIRAVLAAFDWEFDDRQYALEAIERIVTGGEQ